MSPLTQKLKTFLIVHSEFLKFVLKRGTLGVLFIVFLYLIKPFEFLQINFWVFITMIGLIRFLYDFHDFHFPSTHFKNKRLVYIIFLFLFFIFYIVFSTLVSESLVLIMQSTTSLIEIKNIKTAKKNIFLFSALLLFSYRYFSMDVVYSENTKNKKKAKFFRDISQDFIIGTIFTTLISPLFVKNKPDLIGFDYFFNIPVIALIVILDFLNCFFKQGKKGK